MSIALLVSEFSGLTCESLQEALAHACEHQALAAPAVTVNTVPLLGECRACGEVAETGANMLCAVCGAAGVRLCAGETVVIKDCRYG